MDIFLLSKKDIDSKTILRKKLSNMHIALRNMHIAQVSILRPTYIGVAYYSTFEKYFIENVSFSHTPT